MRVIDIARKANVSPETVRYYTRLGLLTPSRDSHSGYHVFNESDYTRLIFIRDARALGIPIADMKTVMHASHSARVSHPEVAALFRSRLCATRKNIKALKPVERRLAGILRDWEQLPCGAPTGREIATLIDTWSEGS